VANKSREYIPRGGEAAWTGPSGFGKARLYAFAVKADAALVHNVLTRYIGRPSQDLGFHIDVRGNQFDHVFFVFLDSERHQPHLEYGRGSEGRQREQIFAVVVVGYRRDPDPGPFLFTPYVIASDTPGWRAEREIYGYPQQRGRVHIEQPESGNPSSLYVVLPAITHFAEDAWTEETGILRIDRRPGATARSGQTLSQAGIAQAIASELKASPGTSGGQIAIPIVPHARPATTAADSSFFERYAHRSAAPQGLTPDTTVLVDELESGRLPMLFLKQFRDVVFADHACYQAIVEAPIDVGGQVGRTRLQEYTLTLKDVDSVPLRRELGIPSGEVPVELAFRLDLKEMAFGTGKVISNPYWNPAVETSLLGTSSRLPRYVDRGGEAVWRQPSLLAGARIYGFGVDVPVQNQEALLKKYINDVADDSHAVYGSRKFELHPVPGLDIMMLMFVEYQRITSMNDDDARLGNTRYLEFLAMQLALSADETSPELDWFIPFIYLDADSPRLAGREIFGYPKQLGRIKFTRYNGGPTVEPAKTLELSATVIHRSSQEHAEHCSIIRIDGPETPPPIRRHYLGPQEMFMDLIKQIGSESRTQGLRQSLPAIAPGASASGIQIEKALTLSNVGNVFLKQFRDCAAPGDACYQAICKTDLVPGNFHGGGSVDPSKYCITIQNHASEPLLACIKGSAFSEPAAKIPVRFAYWLDLDLQLTNGRVIANRFEDPNYVPDLSPGKTARKGEKRRIVRRSRQLEL
jgi:hypothetical protein